MAGRATAVSFDSSASAVATVESRGRSRAKASMATSTQNAESRPWNSPGVDHDLDVGQARHPQMVASSASATESAGTRCDAGGRRWPPRPRSGSGGRRTGVRPAREAPESRRDWSSAAGRGRDRGRGARSNPPGRGRAGACRRRRCDLPTGRHPGWRRSARHEPRRAPTSRRRPTRRPTRRPPIWHPRTGPARLPGTCPSLWPRLPGRASETSRWRGGGRDWTGKRGSGDDEAA